MLDERTAGVARACDDIHHALGQFRLLQNPRKVHRCDACGFRRLEHDGIAAGQCRSELPSRHEQREIPRNNLPANADRAGRATGERILQFIRPARVIEKVCRRLREVEVPRFLDGLAAIQRLQHREFPRAFLDDAGDPVKILPTIRSRHFAPRTVQRLACGGHRGIHVLRVPMRDIRKRLFVRRIDGRKIDAARRCAKLSANEKIILRVGLYHDGLRRGGIFPFSTEVQRPP